MTAEVAAISSDRLTVDISAFDAELQHIINRDGRELQWKGDPVFWTDRAQVALPQQARTPLVIFPSPCSRQA